MDQWVCKSEKYSLSLLPMMENLRTLGCFVDVSLVCEGHTIKAHKLVLAAGSLFIRKILQENPCQHPIIILQDVKYPILIEVVNFLYTGELRVSSLSVKSLLKTARTLDIKCLIELCNQNFQIISGPDLPTSFADSCVLESVQVEEVNQPPSVPFTQINTLDHRDSFISEDVEQLLPKSEIPESSELSPEIVPQIADTRTLNWTEEEEESPEENLMEHLSSDHPDKEFTKHNGETNETTQTPAILFLSQGQTAAKQKNYLKDTENKKARKRSWVWQHFQVCNNHFAVCDTCHAKLSYRTSVTNLTKHLKTKHSYLIKYGRGKKNSSDFACWKPESQTF